MPLLRARDNILHRYDTDAVEDSGGWGVGLVVVAACNTVFLWREVQERADGCVTCIWCALGRTRK